MGWMDKVGGLLKQYTSGSGAAAAPAPDVHAHFDQVAQAAPSSAIAEGLTAMFNSDKTPAFGQMLSTLFNNSSGEQKAGMVNQLLSSVNPAMLTQILGSVGLAGVAASGSYPVDARTSPEAFAGSCSATRRSCTEFESFGRGLRQLLLRPAHHTD